MMAELVLALADPLLGTLPNRLHEVRVALAQLALLVHQAWNVVTDHPCTQGSNVPADQIDRCTVSGRPGKLPGTIIMQKQMCFFLVFFQKDKILYIVKSGPVRCVTSYIFQESMGIHRQFN
jgi:hypothetical protein